MGLLALFLPLFAGSFALGYGITWAITHPRLGRRPLPAAPRKPDYAKIRQLEIELGMREPDAPKPKSAFSGVTTGLGWSIVTTTSQSLPPSRQDSWQGLRESQAAAAKWQTCPVCLRRHEGRCAG